MMRVALVAVLVGVCSLSVIGAASAQFRGGSPGGVIYSGGLGGGYAGAGLGRGYSGAIVPRGGAGGLRYSEAYFPYPNAYGTYGGYNPIGRGRYRYGGGDAYGRRHGAPGPRFGRGGQFGYGYASRGYGVREGGGQMNPYVTAGYGQGSYGATGYGAGYASAPPVTYRIDPGRSSRARFGNGREPAGVYSVTPTGEGALPQVYVVRAPRG